MKYRLIILNEDSFEEKISFKLTRLNVFILGGLFSIILVIATIFLIAFTPLKEYIPGYSSIKLKRDFPIIDVSMPLIKCIKKLDKKHEACIIIRRGNFGVW